MRRFSLFIAVLLLLVPAIVPASAQYPEYGADIQFGVNLTTGAYTAPDFGELRHFWVRYWNASGLYDDAGKTHLDGVAYDGRLLYNPRVSKREGRVYFRSGLPELDRKQYGKVIERYFMPHHVVSDPRLTNWWMAKGAAKSKTLQEAVEKGALSKGFPDVTEAIIDHMVESGAIHRWEIFGMTSSQIQESIVFYTNIALRHNLEQTRQAIGQARLTPEKISLIAKGDVIESYYWPRFGPYPLPARSARVVDVKVDKRKLLVKAFYEGAEHGDPFEIDFTELTRDEFAALRLRKN